MSIVLLSGGLDSAVALAWALDAFKTPAIPISVTYGQRHAREQLSAQRICEYYNLAAPLQVDLRSAFSAIAGSSLTDLQHAGNPSEAAVSRTSDALPPTFVPGRNLVFLAVVGAIAYVKQDFDVVGGWNIVDYSGYPDCRPGFLRSAETAINKALGLWPDLDPLHAAHVTPPGIRIHAPLLYRTKEAIICDGLRHKAPLHLTWSCYAGGATPCGVCDSCKIRAAGFEAVGIADLALSEDL